MFKCVLYYPAKQGVAKNSLEAAPLGIFAKYILTSMYSEQYEKSGSWEKGIVDIANGWDIPKKMWHTNPA